MSYYLKTMGIVQKSYSNPLSECPLWSGTNAIISFKSVDSGRTQFWEGFSPCYMAEDVYICVLTLCRKAAMVFRHPLNDNELFPLGEQTNTWGYFCFPCQSIDCIGTLRGGRGTCLVKSLWA